jgi:hypothetical protein
VRLYHIPEKTGALWNQQAIIGREHRPGHDRLHGRSSLGGRNAPSGPGACSQLPTMFRSPREGFKGSADVGESPALRLSHGDCLGEIQEEPWHTRHEFH